MKVKESCKNNEKSRYCYKIKVIRETKERKNRELESREQLLFLCVYHY